MALDSAIHPALTEEKASSGPPIASTALATSNPGAHNRGSTPLSFIACSSDAAERLNVTCEAVYGMPRWPRCNLQAIK